MQTLEGIRLQRMIHQAERMLRQHIQTLSNLMYHPKASRTPINNRIKLGSLRAKLLSQLLVEKKRTRT